MAITGASLLSDLGAILQDASEVVWTAAIKAKFINEAILAIASLRPDAVAELVTFTVATDTARQSIPDDGFLFIEATRNLAGTYRAITQVDRVQLDRAIPTWAAPADGVTGIEQVMFDPRTPKHFYVYPVPVAGASLDIELIYAKTPTEFTVDSVGIGLDDIWISPLKEYVLYRCFGMNSKRMDSTRSVNHLNTFFNLLSIKTKNDSTMESLQQ